MRNSIDSKEPAIVSGPPEGLNCLEFEMARNILGPHLLVDRPDCNVIWLGILCFLRGDSWAPYTQWKWPEVHNISSSNTFSRWD